MPAADNHQGQAGRRPPGASVARPAPRFKTGKQQNAFNVTQNPKLPAAAPPGFGAATSLPPQRRSPASALGQDVLPAASGHVGDTLRPDCAVAAGVWLAGATISGESGESEDVAA